MADNAQVRAIKNYIVKAHRAGACGKFGEHIPREKMGRNGKGVAYVGPQPWTSPAFQRRYRLAFGHN